MYNGSVTVTELKPSPSFRRLYLLLYLFSTGLLYASSIPLIVKLLLFAGLTAYSFPWVKNALPQPDLKSFSIENEMLVINGVSFPLSAVRVMIKNSCYHWLSFMDSEGKKIWLFFFNDQLDRCQLDNIRYYLVKNKP